jgi:hypothetical protein
MRARGRFEKPKVAAADAAEAEALLPLEEPSSFGLGGRTCRQGGESRGAVDEQKAVSLPARPEMTPIFAALRTRRPSAAKATLHDDVSRGALPRSFSMPRAIRFRRRWVAGHVLHPVDGGRVVRRRRPGGCPDRAGAAALCSRGGLFLQHQSHPRRSLVQHPVRTVRAHTPAANHSSAPLRCCRGCHRKGTKQVRRRQRGRRQRRQRPQPKNNQDSSGGACAACTHAIRTQACGKKPGRQAGT